jgi:hypothetical protein
MFSKVLPFHPAGALLYVSLALITFSGISYAFITGNSGLLDAYERIIIYGHLFIGFIFFLYVMVNFGAIFNEKISIYNFI